MSGFAWELQMDENLNDTQPEAVEDENRKETSDRRQVEDRRGPSAEKSFPIDGYIFREFETAQEAFIVKSGTVEIFKTLNEDGQNPREVQLGVLESGAMFGEMALIDDETRMASARAKDGPVTLYVITHEQFQGKLKGVNPFITKLLHIPAGNVRSSSKKVTE